MNIFLLQHLVGFLQPRITIHETLNIKFIICHSLSARYRINTAPFAGRWHAKRKERQILNNNYYRKSYGLYITYIKITFRGVKFLQKSLKHLKILGARNCDINQSPYWGPQILGDTTNFSSSGHLVHGICTPLDWIFFFNFSKYPW